MKTVTMSCLLSTTKDGYWSRTLLQIYRLPHPLHHWCCCCWFQALPSVRSWPSTSLVGLCGGANWGLYPRPNMQNGACTQDQTGRGTQRKGMLRPIREVGVPGCFHAQRLSFHQCLPLSWASFSLPSTSFFYLPLSLPAILDPFFLF